jgi:hypothetical protein
MIYQKNLHQRKVHVSIDCKVDILGGLEDLLLSNTPNPMFPTTSQLLPPMTSTPVQQTKKDELTDIFGSTTNPETSTAKPAIDLDLLFSSPSSSSSRDGNSLNSFMNSQNLQQEWFANQMPLDLDQ